MVLKSHISKWWDVANDRRQRLILAKHMGKPMTTDQERELEMLQKVAEAMVDYASPPRLADGIVTAARLAVAAANLHRGGVPQ